MEHPFSGSWGYQVTGFFAPTSRFGTPADFKAFVDACHQHGIGVILDWVPGPFSEGRARPRAFRRHGALRARRPAAGRAPRLGHADLQLRAQRGPQLPARERAVLAAGVSRRRPARRRRRLDALPRLLAQRRGVGAEPLRRPREPRGHRVHPPAEHPDARASARARSPIAEESTAWPSVSRPTYIGGLGFTYKWNMGWMNDILQYVKKDPVHRRWDHRHLTFSLLYAFSENFILPFSHDEVVHGKGSMFGKIPGDDWQKAATLRALYGYMYAHPGKKLMFMGVRVRPAARVEPRRAASTGTCSSSRCTPGCSVRPGPEPHLRGGAGASRGRLRLRPASSGSTATTARTASSRSSAAAQSRDDFVVAVLNFTPVPRDGYRIGVPDAGAYTELSTAMRSSTAAATWATAARRHRPIPSHGHAQSSRCAAAARFPAAEAEPLGDSQLPTADSQLPKRSADRLRVPWELASWSWDFHALVTVPFSRSLPTPVR